MTSDRGTLDFYDAEASGYAQMAHDMRLPVEIEVFASALPPKAQVLDLGCGSGWAAHHLSTLGHDVTAMDGSAGLAAQAKTRYGLDVLVQEFTDINWDTQFDGIWAWFTLMHAPRDQMDANLARVARAIKPGGQFVIGFQEGDRDHRDTLGRHYSYFTETDMTARLTRAGFTPTKTLRRPGEHYDGTPTTELSIAAHA